MIKKMAGIVGGALVSLAVSAQPVDFEFQAQISQLCGVLIGGCDPFGLDSTTNSADATSIPTPTTLAGDQSLNIGHDFGDL